MVAPDYILQTAECSQHDHPYMIMLKQEILSKFGWQTVPHEAGVVLKEITVYQHNVLLQAGFILLKACLDHCQLCLRPQII